MTNTVTACNTVNLLDKSTYDQQTRPDTELWAVDEESDSDYKGMVVGWGMPDYTAGISVSYSTLASGYTAPSKGVLMGGCNPNGNTDIKVNNHVVWKTYESVNPLFIPMNKDDVAQIGSIDSGDNNIIFYPYIGV